MYECPCIFTCGYVYMYMGMCAEMYGCICVFLFVFICVYLCVFVDRNMYVQVWVYFYMHAFCVGGFFNKYVHMPAPLGVWVHMTWGYIVMCEVKNVYTQFKGAGVFNKKHLLVCLLLIYLCPGEVILC